MAAQRIPPIQCLLSFGALAHLRSVSMTAEELNVTPSLSHEVNPACSRQYLHESGPFDGFDTRDAVARARPGGGNATLRRCRLPARHHETETNT